MKRRLFLTCLVFLVSQVAVDAQEREETPASPLLGTWKLMSAKTEAEGEFREPELTMLKHITDTHFTWVRFDPKSKRITQAGGGRYVVEGDKYIETVEYGLGTVMSLKGKEQRFDWKVQGNRFYQVGALSDGTYIAEMFERVQPKPKWPSP